MSTPAVPLREERDGARFERIRLIGSGSFGEVWEARDKLHGTRVALKVLSALEPASLLRFKHEFRGLAHLSHRNLVELYELASDGGQWMLSMELVVGDDYLEWTRPGRGAQGLIRDRPTASDGTRDNDDTLDDGGDDTIDENPRPLPASGALDIHRLRATLPQLTRAVSHLHDCGIVHRDLKPSNVLVSRQGRVVVLDFGLATDEAAGVSELGPAGTLGYMAPEVLEGRKATPASDWYAVGVMIYVALTGKRPWETRWEVLDASAPPDPRHEAPDAPDDLADLCCDLMRADPKSRPDGDEVWARLGMRGRKRASVTAPLGRKARIIGRKDELELLARAIGVAARRPTAVAITGLSGMGKSAMIDAFLDRAKSLKPEDLLVLRTRCYRRETVPFKAMDGVIDALVRHLIQLDPAYQQALVPPELEASARVFPVLAPFVRGGRLDPSADSSERRREAFRGLRILLQRISRRRHVVIFIDDLQWGDVDSIELVRSLLRPPDPPSVLLVMTWRGNEPADHPVISSALRLEEDGVGFQSADLGPLTYPETREMAKSLMRRTGPDADRRASAIAGEAAGNPFFVAELVRASEREAATPFDVERSSRLSLDAILKRRIASVPPQARATLDLVAFAGRPIEAALVREILGGDFDQHATFRLLQKRSLVSMDAAMGAGHVAIWHDRIREAVVGELDAETQVRLHLDLARAYESREAMAVETILLHYHQAGHQARAAILAVRAARVAVESLAFDRAADLYRYALDYGSPTAGGRRSLLAALARVLAAAGRGAEAAESFLEAAQGADRLERLRRILCAATQLLVIGRFDEGRDAIAGVLSELGLPAVDASGDEPAALRSIRLRVRLRGTRAAEDTADEASAEQLLRIDACWTLATTMAAVDPVLGTIWHSRALFEALEAREPSRVALTLAQEAAFRSVRGERAARRARRLLDRARVIAERTQSGRATAHVSVVESVIEFMSGRWHEAHAASRDAVARLRARPGGDGAWERGMAEIVRLLSLHWSGALHEARCAAAEVLAEAADRGDRQLAALGTFVHCLSDLLPAGKIDEAETRISSIFVPDRSVRYGMQHWWREYIRSECDLYRGDPRAALARLSQARKAMKASGLSRMNAVQGFALDQHGRALVALGEWLGEAERRRCARKARRVASKLDRLGSSWGRAAALRLRAGIAALFGDTERAADLFAEASDRFDQHQMTLWSVVCRRRQATLLDDQEALRRIDLSLDVLGVSDPAVTADRLAPGLRG